MDPYSIYVEGFPKETTYVDLKDTFCKYQRTPPLEIMKKEHYAIITFEKSKTVLQILRKKDQSIVKGKAVTIQEAYKKIAPTYIHIPPSFHLSPEVLVPLPPPPPPPPRYLLVPPFFIPGPPPPAPTPPPAPPAYNHPFPKGFSYFFYK